MKGEQHSEAKLTEQQVRKIIDALQTGHCTQIELAKWFAVSQSTICNIRNKRSWKHVWDQPLSEA